MQQRIKINLGKVSVPEIGLEVENAVIELEGEAGLQEMTGVVGLIKDTVKAIPEILTNLATGYKTFVQLNEELKGVTELDIDQNKNGGESDGNDIR